MFERQQDPFNRKCRLVVRGQFEEIDLVLDLMSELGAPQVAPPPCDHTWMFVPPERSAGVIRECRGFGVLICENCGAFETASAADLDGFRLGIIADILLLCPKGVKTGKRTGLL